MKNQAEADHQHRMTATSGTPVPIGRTAAIRRTFMALADQGVVSGGNVLMTVVIGRVLGAEALGLYILLFTALLMASSILDAALSATFLARQPELGASGCRGYVTACLVIALTCSGVLALAAWIMLWVTDKMRFVGGAGAIVAVLVPAFLMREHMRRYEFAFLRLDAALKLDGLTMGVQFVLIGVLLSAREASLGNCLLAMAAGNFVGGGTAWLRRRSEFNLSEVRLPEVLRDIVLLSPGVLLAQFLLIAGLQIMPWIVMFKMGTLAAGTYGACMTLANIANPLLTGFVNLMMPGAAAAYPGGPAAVWLALRRDVLLMGLAVAGIAGVTAVFANDSLDLVFSGRYSDASSLLRLLCAAFFVRSLDIGAYVGCWALRYTNRNVFANLIGIIVAVLLAIALMPSLGLYGVGLGMLIGNVAGVLVRWGMFLRLYLPPASQPPVSASRLNM